MTDGETVTATDEEFRRALGRRVRLRRRVLELTQQDVADRAGISRSYVSLFETGDYGIDVMTLRRLARALGVSLPELVEEPLPELDQVRR